MGDTETDKVAERVAEQRRLYGEPIGVLVRRVVSALGLTQARVAEVLGLSPAMLSQLASGQRVKIGNPLAVARLQRLLDLTEEAPSLTREGLGRRLEEIGTSRTALTTGQLSPGRVEPADLVRRVLRAVASGQELDQAARALADSAPDLAELLRVYGTGSPEDARRHYDAIAHLI